MTDLDKVQAKEGEASAVVIPDKVTPGYLLRQARVQAGLNQLQVSKALFLTVTKVNALELDDYDRLGAPAYARGYLKAYANFLKLDDVQVLHCYEQVLADNATALLPCAIAPVAKNASQRAWQFLAGISVFFIVLWLMSIWFIDDHVDKKYTQPPANLSSLAAAVDNLPVVANPVEKTEAGVVQPQEIVLAKMAVAASAAVINSAASNTLVIASSSIASGNEKKNSLDELAFSFRQECWLEVSDTRGDVLATELQSAGSRLRLVGKAPFEIKLGNAPAVTLLFNGKKVNVKPLADTNVLTMAVGD
jgi:cytoskeleton protein RodZ